MWGSRAVCNAFYKKPKPNILNILNVAFSFIVQRIYFYIRFGVTFFPHLSRFTTFLIRVLVLVLDLVCSIQVFNLTTFWFFFCALFSSKIFNGVKLYVERVENQQIEYREWNFIEISFMDTFYGLERPLIQNKCTKLCELRSLTL